MTDRVFTCSFLPLTINRERKDMHPVRKARLNAGLNLRQLADLSSLSMTTLHKVESGVPVSELTTFRVATALGLDPEELLEDLHAESEPAQASPGRSPEKQTA